MGEPQNIPLLRVQLCLKKKDEVTDEFFHDYWRGNHVKLALENKKFVDKVVRYNQWHTSPRLKEAAAKFKIPVPEYDGIAEVWVKDIETWESIVTDEDFVAAIAPDEAHFIKAPIHIMLGYDHTVIGEAVKAE
ncbi:hypothetical protein K458DRAFT_391809 [Lentithecium fluviatile CBS 122367]|uniref:EthD domain-containing protein n=1 Tax=Lentithecium fluviatile CBS 122367 TaxID=1168545 RepID=A0A6G1ITZ9_9PLEO|nr:hypothetical protein K458DRAFT_391809 [Lentithecium fluviatile CBS 122367]